MDPCWVSAYEISLDSSWLYRHIQWGRNSNCKELTSDFNSALMPRPHGGPWCFLTWINVQQVLRQQVCVVVGSALRSEWLLRARGRCRARASVGGTSLWSSLEFLRTIAIVCFRLCLYVCEGQVLHTLWAANLTSRKRKAAVRLYVTIIMWFRLNIISSVLKQ